MINDIFNGIDLGIGAAFYAGDGTLWKRGRNIDYITVLQKAITGVERLSITWGLGYLLVNQTMFFSRKNIKLYLYGNPLERVSVYISLSMVENYDD